MPTPAPKRTPGEYIRMNLPPGFPTGVPEPSPTPSLMTPIASSSFSTAVRSDGPYTAIPVGVPLPLPAGCRYHVFLSHDWGTDRLGRSNHQRVSRLNADLKRAGLVTWFDEERMEGNIIDQMTCGIDDSACVIVCITRNYIEKVAGKNGLNDNCKREFEYADLRKGPKGRLLAVVMEAECRDQNSWAGSVGFVMGRKLYVDFSEDERGRWDKQVGGVVQRVRAMLSG
jgi:hypothetical protein